MWLKDCEFHLFAWLVFVIYLLLPHTDEIGNIMTLTACEFYLFALLVFVIKLLSHNNGMGNLMPLTASKLH